MKKYTEEELRSMFEISFSENTYLVKDRDGAYVYEIIRASWEGFQKGFNKAMELNNKPGKGYVAIRYAEYHDGLWHIVPKQMFEKNLYMDDEYSDIVLPDFQQGHNHQFQYLFVGDGEHKLVELGFEIINNPKYRFDSKKEDKH